MHANTTIRAGCHMRKFIACVIGSLFLGLWVQASLAQCTQVPGGPAKCAPHMRPQVMMPPPSGANVFGPAGYPPPGYGAPQIPPVTYPTGGFGPPSIGAPSVPPPSGGYAAVPAPAMPGVPPGAATICFTPSGNCYLLNAQIPGSGCACTDPGSGQSFLGYAQ